jgi:hypothetical protein
MDLVDKGLQNSKTGGGIFGSPEWLSMRHLQSTHLIPVVIIDFIMLFADK